jgi:site-specific recombinase XerD
MAWPEPIAGRRVVGVAAARGAVAAKRQRPSTRPTASRAGLFRAARAAGSAAELGFKAHPHMLRHACGFALANKGHDTRALQAYLGHKNIQHTVRYTELSSDRFKDYWR